MTKRTKTNNTDSHTTSASTDPSAQREALAKLTDLALYQRFVRAFENGRQEDLLHIMAVMIRDGRDKALFHYMNLLDPQLQSAITTMFERRVPLVENGICAALCGSFVVLNADSAREIARSGPPPANVLLRPGQKGSDSIARARGIGYWVEPAAFARLIPSDKRALLRALIHGRATEHILAPASFLETGEHIYLALAAFLVTTDEVAEIVVEGVLPTQERVQETMTMVRQLSEHDLVARFRKAYRRTHGVHTLVTQAEASDVDKLNRCHLALLH